MRRSDPITDPAPASPRPTLTGLILALCLAAGFAPPAGGQGPLEIYAAGEPRLRNAALWVTRGETVLFEERLGRYDTDTVLPLGAASQWLVSATLLTLVDDGRLRLDDPVARHLPAVTGPAGAATVRQLLAHTSGLPGHHPCLADRATTLTACAGAIADGELRAEPGREFAYGGASYQLAGRVAEVAAGASWAELFAERLARPLGMADTDFGPGDNPRLSAGARSSPRDYGRFLRMLLDGGEVDGRRVLSAEALREMRADQRRGIRVAYAPRSAAGYGLGVWLDAARGGEGTLLSCPGEFGFRPWLDLPRSLAGILATIAPPAAVDPLMEKLRAAALSASREAEDDDPGTGGGG